VFDERLDETSLLLFSEVTYVQSYLPQRAQRRRFK
jgi:hypothetical protein